MSSTPPTGYGPPLPPGGPEAATAAPFPPPPTPFRDPGTSARLASRWLSFTLLVSVAALVVDLLFIRDSDSPATSLDRLVSLGHLIDTFGVIQLVIYVAGAVIFIVWFHRAYGNLEALGIQPWRTPGWAIGAWFIPIANLVIPKQMANDIWRSGAPESDAPGRAWLSRPVASVVHWWWGLWIANNIGDRVASTMMRDADSFDAARSAVVADLISQLLAIAAALAAISVVKRSSARQQARLA